MINVRIAEPLKFSLNRNDDNAPGKLTIDRFLAEVARETLNHAEAPTDIEMTLVVSDDAQLRQLNQDFLGIDSPTDVLAFQVGDIDPDTGSLYLGDVILSYQQAQIQATSAGQPVIDELSLLVVHGVLHLLGYDHDNDENMSAMWKIQNEILRRITLPNGRISRYRPTHPFEENEAIS